MAEKRLTKGIAGQCRADRWSVKLTEFTELDDDATESLSNIKGQLGLEGLTSLSDAAAESLNKHDSARLGFRTFQRTQIP